MGANAPYVNHSKEGTLGQGGGAAARRHEQAAVGERAVDRSSAVEQADLGAAALTAGRNGDGDVLLALVAGKGSLAATAAYLDLTLNQPLLAELLECVFGHESGFVEPRGDLLDLDEAITAKARDGCERFLLHRLQCRKELEAPVGAHELNLFDQSYAVNPSEEGVGDYGGPREGATTEPLLGGGSVVGRNSD